MARSANRARPRPSIRLLDAVHGADSGLSLHVQLPSPSSAGSPHQGVRLPAPTLCTDRGSNCIVTRTRRQFWRQCRAAILRHSSRSKLGVRRTCCCAFAVTLRRRLKVGRENTEIPLNFPSSCRTYIWHLSCRHFLQALCGIYGQLCVRIGFSNCVTQCHIVPVSQGAKIGSPRLVRSGEEISCFF